MGQLVVAIAGGVIGSFFGMPQLGFLAGSLLGSMLFPQKSSGGGGRLNDLRVTSSTYGMPIPRLWGTVRIGGNIIYAQDISEHKHKNKVGKGGQSQTTYSYTWSGAVGLCVGPITDVVKIWADTKLVYDKTGASTNAFNKYKLKFRLYKGTETQTPDALADSMFGSANSQSHRGMAYIVFDNIPLDDYGNRVPNWTFEVVVNGSTTTAQTGYGFTYPTNQTVGETFAGAALIDWDRNRVFYLREGRESGLGFSPDAGIHACHIDSGAQYFEQNIVNVVGAGTMRYINTIDGGAACIGKDGFLYFASEVGNHCAFEKVDPETLITAGHFGTGDNTFDNDASGLASPHAMTSIQIPSTNATFIVDGTPYGGGHGAVSGFCGDTMTFAGFDFDTDEDFPSPCAGPQTADTATAIYIVKAHYIGQTDTTPIGVYRLTIGAGAEGFDPVVWPDAGNAAVGFTKSGTFTYTDVDPTSNGFIDVMGPAYDPSDGNILVQCVMHYAVGSNKIFMVKVDSNDAHVIWSTNTGGTSTQSLESSFNGDMAMSQSRILNGKYAFVTGGNGGGIDAKVWVIDTSDGSILVENWTNQLGQYVGSQQHWDEEKGAIILAGVDPNLPNGASARWIIIYPGRAVGAGITLGIIVGDICKMVSFTDADLDVTDLTEIVPGYLMAQQMTARDAISPLALVYFFDGFESDDKLKFVHRGKSPIVTIPASDLARLDTKKNALVNITRLQEVDLPVQVSLNFFDPNRDYQTGTAIVKRPLKPSPVMYSHNIMSEDVPIVLDPTDAKQACERTLYSAWINRIQYKVKLPWQYMKYDPTDVAILHPDVQTVVTARLVNVDVGVDYTVESQFVSESGESYNNTTQPVDSYDATATTAYGGEGFTPQQIKVPGATKLILLDTPLLQDIDDTGQTFTLLYYAAGGFNSSWPGFELFKSADQTSYVDVGGVTQPAAWGSAVTALGDPEDVFVMDEVNTVTIAMQQGGDSLASITDLELVNGGNGAVLVKANGETEVIQFRDVTTNADGTYTLSNLLRGRRGSDTMAHGHAANESFVLLTPASGVSNVDIGLGEKDLLRYYKPVTKGTLFENAPVTQFTARARPLFPYAPNEVAATIAGSDIDLTWTRRTRISGAWNDNTGIVPLAEESEAYEIDIYDAPGTTILRTLSVDFGPTPVAFPDKLYLAADITTDFGSIPATLTLAVYQISGAIGRGFGNKVTVPVV